MGPALLLLFLTIPLVEIAVFIQVGGWIGLWPTIALVILTAVLGSWQLRTQGLATLARARQQMDRGEIPARELFDGVCLVAAGALLLTPGFVTDLAGASLFVPPVREFLRRRLARSVQARAAAGGASGGTAMRTRVFIDGQEVSPRAAADPHSRWGRGPHGAARGPGAAPGIIEGDWTEVQAGQPGEGDEGSPHDDALEGPSADEADTTEEERR